MSSCVSGVGAVMLRLATERKNEVDELGGLLRTGGGDIGLKRDGAGGVACTSIGMSLLSAPLSSS